jgi:glutaredoxin 3
MEAGSYQWKDKDAIMNDRQITVYSQPFWGPCSALAEYLTSKGVEFAKKDLMIDEEAREELFKLGVRAAPALVVDGEVAVGFNKARIDELLNLWSHQKIGIFYAYKSC